MYEMHFECELPILEVSLEHSDSELEALVVLVMVLPHPTSTVL
jgi:hypothetical protein